MAGAVFAGARTLTPAEAYQRMAQQNSNPAKVRSLGQLDINAPAKTINMATGKAAVYMFVGSDSSYVLVGADDLALPLLGYGSVGHGAEMPPQMVAWLDGYARQIAWADSVSANRQQTGLVGAKLAERNAPRKASLAAIEPRVKTTWNQSEPYNDQCPMDGYERSVTGCVATALAQVMNYYQWPVRGTGTGTATVRGKNPTSKSLDITFDWGNMLNSYSAGSYSPTQGDAVAQLMVACGYAVSMNYSADASGAGDAGVYDAVINHFNYDKTSWLYYRDYYSLAEWREMLYNQLADNGPTYYSGSSSEGGHAFVCDGYDGNGNFHFNWGWGGYYDGYFAIDALNPDGQGIGGFEGGYNTGQSAMLGIRKPVAGSVRPQVQLGADVYGNGSDLEASISGSELTLYMPFWNIGPNGVDFTGDVGVEFTNISTGQSSVSYLMRNVSVDYGYGTESSYTIALPSLADGTYRVRYVTKENGYSNWVPILNVYSYANYCCVQYANGKASIVDNPSPDPEEEFSIESATGPEYLVKGASASYTISIKNTYPFSKSATLAPGIVVWASNEGYLVANATPVTFTVDANSTMTKTVTFNLVYDDSFDPEANNHLVLYLPDVMKVAYDFGPIEVIEEDECDFYIESATGPEYLVKGESSSYTIKIKNTYSYSRSTSLAPAIVEGTSDDATPVAKADAVAFIVDANSTLTKTVPFDLVYTDSFNPEANNYLVLIDTENAGIVYRFGQIEVREGVVSEFCIESATGPEYIVKGESSSYTIKLKNTYPVSKSASYAPAIVVGAADDASPVAKADAVTFTVDANSTMDKTVTFNLAYEDSFDFEANNYLVLFDAEFTEIVYRFGPIEVREPAPAVPSVTALSMLPEFGHNTDVTVDVDLTVVYANGSYNYVYDGTSYGLIYKKGLNLMPGQVVAKGWEATVTVYAGLIDLVPKDAALEVSGTADIPAAVRVAPDEINKWLIPENQNTYVTIEDVIFSAPTPAASETVTQDRTFTGTVGGTPVTFFQRFGVESVPAGEYEVVGFISVFNETVQIYPISFTPL